MAFSILSGLVSAFVAILKIPFFLLLCAAFMFFLLYMGQVFYLRSKGYEMPKGEHKRVKKKGFFYRLFVLAPRQIALDRFSTSPDFFRHQGFHVFCGEQGSGKTIAMVEFVQRIQKEYPKSKCITNFAYAHENAPLTKWQQLLTYNNEKLGVIVGIDEVQNWFASGKNTLPTEMLEVVTQNRKNRRIIVATSQVFTRMAKGLREQCTLMYQPITLWGAITWVRIKKPVLDSEGNVQSYKSRGNYFFVHTKELRESYDTYKVIHSLAQEGFKEAKAVVETTTNVLVKAK